MYQELRPQGVEVIGVAEPPRDSLELMLHEHHATLPVAMEEKDYKDTTSVQKLFNAYVKVWFVVDSSRRVVYVGNYNPEKIRAALNTLGATWPRKGAH